MLNDLRKSLEEFISESKEKSFSETISGARTAIGLTQYKTADYLKMPLARLKLLEQGHFRLKPRDEEIKRLCAFYGLPERFLESKAKTQIYQSKEI